MVNLRTILKKYAIFRVSYTIMRTSIEITKSLIFMWGPFAWKNPKIIRFLPQWILSVLPGREPYKDGFPLIPFEAAQWLDNFLTRDMTVFEYGSGGSTLFIAQRVKKIITVEHHPKWYQIISQLLKEKNISNCQYLFKKPQPSENNPLDPKNPQHYFSNPRGKNLIFKEYCKSIESYPDNFFDLVFIDGRARASCILHARRKIRKGGFLFLDDSNRKNYPRGIALLKGWKRKDFLGPKPYVQQAAQASIWQRIIS